MPFLPPSYGSAYSPSRRDKIGVPEMPGALTAHANYNGTNQNVEQRMQREVTRR
jgi:hypothetical protein